MIDKPKIDPVYEAVLEIKQSVAVLEVNVKQNTKDLSEHIEGVRMARARIERLEKFDTFLKGAWATVGAVAVIAGLLFSISKLMKG